MAQYQARNPKVEVLGAAVMSFVDALSYRKQEALAILARHSINDPHADTWYTQQDWLDAFKEIAEEFGPHTLYTIGTKINENAVFPPNIETLEQAFTSIDVAYHQNHRNGDIGSYDFHEDAQGQMFFECNNPYPCEFDRGIIEGIGRKFIEPGHFLVVRHDDDKPCRDHGAESCHYTIELS